MTMTIGTRQVAIYARVSSDDQAERGTIATQLAEIDHWLARNPEVDVVERYLDDGVSGMSARRGRGSCATPRLGGSRKFSSTGTTASGETSSTSRSHGAGSMSSRSP
jgi:predicted site-specific integrase-resolvase